MTPPDDDPRWPRASDWLAGNSLPDATIRLALVGVPLRLGSITPGRCDLAPRAIRAALRRFSTYDFELDRDVRAVALEDTGDLDIAALDPAAAFEPVKNALAALQSADAVAVLGGDNSLTRPAVHGLGRPLSSCGLLTLDAHLDLRDPVPLSNGNPIRALLGDGLPGANIEQIGIQSFANSCAYAEVARAAGITVTTADEVRMRGIATLVQRSLDRLASRCDVIYVDFDLDVMDRAFAPATPGSRPGGLLPSDLRIAARICGLNPKVRAMDLVELDPAQDKSDVTTLTAAACLLSFASGLLGR